METTPNTRMEARERRIEEKMAMLKEKFFGDHGLDWVMLDLVELKPECMAEDEVDAEDRVEDEEVGLCIWASTTSSRNSWHVRGGTVPRAECPAGHHDVSSGCGKKVEATNGFDLTASVRVPEDVPLVVVVPEVEASSRSHRRARVARESDEEEIEEGEGWRNEGSVEPSGDERKELEGGQSDNSNSSYDSRKEARPASPQEKARLDRFMAKHELSKGTDLIRDAAAPSKAGEREREWDKDFVVVKGNYENTEGEEEYKLQHRVLTNPKRYIDELIDHDEAWVNWVFGKLGIVRKRRKKTDTLLRNVPVAARPTNKRREEGASKRAEEMKKGRLIRKSSYVRREWRGGPGAVQQSVPEAIPEVSKQASKGKGKAVAEALAVHVTQDELEEQARATAASMVTLCGNDPDEAGKQMNKALYQIRAECAREIEASVANNNQIRNFLELKLAEKEVLEEQRVAFEAQYDEECYTTTFLKNFLDSLGYNLRTFQRFPSTKESAVEDAVQSVGIEVDLASGGGAVVVGSADAVGLNPIVEGTGGVAVEEPVRGVMRLLLYEWSTGRSYESSSPIQVLLHQFFAVGDSQSTKDCPKAGMTLFGVLILTSTADLSLMKTQFNSNDLNVAKSEANQIAKSKKGQKRYSTEREDELEDNSEEHYTSKKKTRVSWSQPLHEKFIEAVKKLGTKVVPLKILKYMNVPGITSENVASYLQEFRSVIKKTDGDQSNMSSVSNGVNGYTSSTPLISFGGQGRNGLNFVNAFSGYPTPRMIPFTHHAQNPTTITNSFVNPNPLSVSIYLCHGIINQQLPRFYEGLDQNYRSRSIPGIGDVTSNSLRTRNHFHNHN
ncbi:hypothetical protein GIB67_031113 [Kingdonia uniflora]|uniref:Myb-like domain-containing protein n=1 Tax=Kingdonia uniflora TaxID=39325 RepID=A0A7J7ME08_9MAGN|nr:hypothetical protein GIB67_031113 [Kingdonia uniflora]